MCEKPSHCTSLEAEEFKAQIEEQGIDPKRFLIGMHSPLHPSRGQLIDLIEASKDKITDIYIVFNYPKNPHLPGDVRVYKKPIGGVMLDLGVYVFQMARQIGEVVGFDLFSFQKEIKDVFIKRTQEGIDVEVVADLMFNGIKVRLETKMNPGT